MDSLKIQDVFDPYYVGRKPFLPKTTRVRAMKSGKKAADKTRSLREKRSRKSASAL